MIFDTQWEDTKFRGSGGADKVCVGKWGLVWGKERMCVCGVGWLGRNWMPWLKDRRRPASATSLDKFMSLPSLFFLFSQMGSTSSRGGCREWICLSSGKHVRPVAGEGP